MSGLPALSALCVFRKQHDLEMTEVKLKQKVRAQLVNKLVNKSFSMSGLKPLILTTSTTLNLTIPQGLQLSVFLVGGGGAADTSTAGSSGFFKHEILVLNETQSFVLEVTIGKGGWSSGVNGEITQQSGAFLL